MEDRQGLGLRPQGKGSTQRLVVCSEQTSWCWKVKDLNEGGVGTWKVPVSLGESTLNTFGGRSL